MSGIIAYGSLMSAAELEPYGIRCTNAYPVTVLGFRRSFNKEPSRRKGAGNRRGVLTVSPNDQTSMSAILIPEISVSAFAALDEREGGYDRVGVHKARIQPFADARSDIDRRDAFIYVGKPHKFNSKLEPNADYLTLCVNAAGEWGEAFRKTFLDTTFVSDVSLAEYTENA